MKNYLYFLSGIAIVFLLLTSEIEYGSGSPGGKTGSPGDGGATCTECHNGSAISQSNWISTTIPAEGYTPGETYTITATGTHNGVVKFGFEATAESASATKVGTFIITNNTETKLINANKAVTHKSAGTTPSGNSKSWQFNWTAPVQGTGNVTFYAAFNAANGNGTTSGDVIYKTLLTVPEFIPPVNGITINFSNMNPQAGQKFEARLIDKYDQSEVERILIGAIPGSSFSILFTNITAGHSYWIDFYADHNNNGHYDPVPTDRAWRLTLNNAEASNTIDFVYNTNFTEIYWKGMYKLQFHGMSPNIGKKLEVRLTEQSTLKEVGRKKLNQIPSDEFAVFMPYLETGKNYIVDFYADQNGNGVYDAPPVDHAWTMELTNVEGDEDDDFVYSTNFTDIGWNYLVKLNASQMVPHLGELFELRLVNQATLQEAGRIRLDSIVLPDFSVMAAGLQLNEDYFIDFYADHNGNGIYDPPPTDHAWRLTLNDVTGDSELDFVHNTNFTNIEWPFTSLKENYLIDQINIFPNPVRDLFNVSIGKTGNTALALKLFTASGLMVESKAVNNEDEAIRFQMDGKRSGIYYLMIEFDNGMVVTKSIVKL